MLFKRIRLRRVVGQLVKAALVTSWALVASEMYLRAFSPQRRLPRYVCALPYGIRGNMPNQTYWHHSPGYDITMRTNSRGMRADREFNYEKPSGTQRIVVLGDSYGMGYEVNIEDSFLARMDNSLASMGIKCETINLSVSGYGSAEELLVLQNEGMRYKPDLVLLVWHGTDLDDNIRCGLFGLEGDKLVRQSETYLPAVKINEMLFSYKAYRWLAGDCHLYCWAREWAGERVQKLLILGQTVGRKEKSAPATAPAARKLEVQQRSYGQRLSVALLREITRIVEASGARLLILDVPDKSSALDLSSRFPVSDGQELGKSAQFVNPIGMLEQHADEHLFWDQGDWHFTPVGCRLIGQLLADCIGREGLLGRSSDGSK